MWSRLKRLVRAHVARHDALILTYHSVLAEPLPFPIPHHLAAERFEKQIGYLAQNFRCVSLSTLVRELKERRISPYTVAVTFDDGFGNNYSAAYPILKKYQVPATIFVPTHFIGGSGVMWPEHLACVLALSKEPAIKVRDRSFAVRNAREKAAAYKALTRSFKPLGPAEIDARIEQLTRSAGLQREEIEHSPIHAAMRLLNWSEIDEMLQSPLIELGSHTITHRRLQQLASDEALREIVESKRDLEQHIGKVKWFAYPYGGREDDFTDEHRDMAIQAGYEAVATSIAGTINRDSDVFALPRLSIGANISDEAFDYLLQGGTAFGNGATPLARIKRTLRLGIG